LHVTLNDIPNPKTLGGTIPISKGERFSEGIFASHTDEIGTWVNIGAITDSLS
jgi:hypothetical protein